MTFDESIMRMKSGKIYFCNDEEIVDIQLKHLDLLFDYNSLKPSKIKEKNELLSKMFGKIGENCYIETPFHANWGGKNVYMGDNVYANFNLTLVDDCDIIIGNNVLFAPNVTVITATHPVEPDLRSRQAQFNLPVTIGDNVWIGAGAVIMPNITIGKNSVIGAGAVVTKDIPENVVAFGNPCRVYREINDNDREYYYKNMKIDID